VSLAVRPAHNKRFESQQKHGVMAGQQEEITVRIGANAFATQTPGCGEMERHATRSSDTMLLDLKNARKDSPCSYRTSEFGTDSATEPLQQKWQVPPSFENLHRRTGRKDQAEERCSSRLQNRSRESQNAADALRCIPTVRQGMSIPPPQRTRNLGSSHERIERQDNKHVQRPASRLSSRRREDAATQYGSQQDLQIDNYDSGKDGCLRVQRASLRPFGWAGFHHKEQNLPPNPSHPLKRYDICPVSVRHQSRGSRRTHSVEYEDLEESEQGIEEMWMLFIFGNHFSTPSNG
jgi:hypothetical protein